MFDDSMGWSIDDFTVHTILMEAESRDDADAIAGRKLTHVVSHGFNNARSLIAQTSREFGLVNILAVTIHNFRTVNADCAYAYLNFIRTRSQNWHILYCQDVSVAWLIKNHDLRHSKPL
ncbi:hypothetical protein SDC9_187476 [bioreactor metagenome]|uniref:Uncharacterized protein n=1 Tax=bioreactor metagenome TaxID=1076179 RepID=A0A645HNB5_9ZZZZ